MASLPQHPPSHLSLGHLEQEILTILWQLGRATVKQVHDQILANPDRELAYASVTTVLQRLAHKGWVECDRTGKAFYWQARISATEARSLEAYNQLHRFLAVGDAEIVAAFADQLDRVSVDKLAAIADKLKQIRQQQ
ncbi:MAG: BlaI/MecI/CopY family transcriptional regulator [Pseudanabaenaceae cyanobacterium bins.68]|nr:BlaI/MecI/CopY family transcriptional regulator [Pseudanabaenaceae cyanobacterium bins.68]